MKNDSSKALQSSGHTQVTDVVTDEITQNNLLLVSFFRGKGFFLSLKKDNWSLDS